MITNGTTWLRVATYKVEVASPHAKRYMQHEIVEALRVLEKQSGFQLGYWGRDLDEHTMAAVTYWRSRQAIEAAEPTLAVLRAKAAAHGVRPFDIRNLRLFALPPS